MTVAMVTFSIASMGQVKDKSRPHVAASFHGTKLDTLVDTGASITCVSEKFFKTVFGNWDIARLPLPRHIRVSGITGHAIKITDFVEVEIELLGRKIRRPVLVVSGLDQKSVV